MKRGPTAVTFSGGGSSQSQYEIAKATTPPPLTPGRPSILLIQASSEVDMLKTPANISNSTSNSRLNDINSNASAPVVPSRTAILPRSKSQLRYRRGVSLSFANNGNANNLTSKPGNNNNNSNNQNQEAATLRDALLRHDASLNRAGVAVNHLQPVDRHALTARGHFRPDPNVDSLAQHLRWSTAKSATGGNPGFAETEVLAAARESYHPIAPPVPSMQISIKSLPTKPVPLASQQQSPVPESPKSSRQSPVLLVSSHHPQQQRLVSVENRPATSASATSSSNFQLQRQAPVHASSAQAALLPAAADLRKQFDVYQRGTNYPPQTSSTKYLYKPEHGWLVKNARERRNLAAIAQGNNNNTNTNGNCNNNNNNNIAPSQLVIGGNNNNANMATSAMNISSTAYTSAEMLSATLNVSAMPHTPPPPQANSPEPSRSSTARAQQQQQRTGVISASSSAAKTPPTSSNNNVVHHVSVVDFNEYDDADNPLKITSVNSGNVQHPLRSSAVSRRPHPQTSVEFVQQQPQQPTRSSSTGSQLAANAASQQPMLMMVSSKQHPAALRAKKLRDLFSSYDDFKRAAEDYANKFPALPHDLSGSPYLNEAKQRQIWCWLHYGENISDVEYLLSVC